MGQKRTTASPGATPSAARGKRKAENQLAKESNRTRSPCWLPFGQAIAPLLSPTGLSAALLLSPRLIRAWAEVVATYWGRLERLGGLDLTQPLYVLDFTPGDGTFAAAFVQALQAEMQGRGMVGWPVRHVLCALDTDAAADPAAQPRLQALRAQGVVDWARWNGRTGHPLLLGAQRAPLFGVRNPVVALSAGGLSRLQQDLYAVHHGRLLRARAAATPLRDRGRGHALALDWQPVEPADIGSASVAAALDRYRESLVSAPFLLSEPALALAEAVQDFSARGYLILAADRGIACESRLRQGCLAAPEEINEPIELPVNFNALGVQQENAGARVANLALGQDDWVVHIASRNNVADQDDASWVHLVGLAQRAHPGDMAWHTRPMQTCGASEMLYRLRDSGFDPQTLQRIAQHVDSVELDCRTAEESQLREGLLQAWAHTAANGRQPHMCLSLAQLLCRLRDWTQAEAVLDSAALSGDKTGVRAATWLRAKIEAATGRTAQALWRSRQLPAGAPVDPETARWVEVLHTRAAQWADHPWYHPGIAGEDDLLLEPLDALHYGDFLHHFRDPEIAISAGLPPIDTAAALHDHCEDARASHGAELAIVHRRRGFVGSVGMRRAGDMAHVHFWIGTDHQGRGFCAPAVGLMLALLRNAGVRHCFASMISGNARSARVLRRSGFVEVERGSGQDQGLDFLYLPLAPSAACGEHATASRLLRQLFTALQCPLDDPSGGPVQISTEFLAHGTT